MVHSTCRKDALRNSPQLHLEEEGPEIVVPNLPILVIVGQDDSPEFHRQSWEFYQVPHPPTSTPLTNHQGQGPGMGLSLPFEVIIGQTPGIPEMVL